MSDDTQEVVEIPGDDSQSFRLTPPAEMRRGAAVMVVICVVAVALGRFLFWHGEKTAGIPATILFFLLIYTIFGFIQFALGVSFNELSQNFMRAPGRYKALFVLMIGLTVGLLWASSDVLFPGISDKIPIR